MNKSIIMVLAVIVALLAGWLVLSVATTFPPEQDPAPSGGSMQIAPPEVPTPSSVDISVTVVEELEPTDASDITAEIITP